MDNIDQNFTVEEVEVLKGIIFSSEKDCKKKDLTKKSRNCPKGKNEVLNIFCTNFLNL